MKLDANISIGAVCRAMAVPEFAGAVIKAVRITVSYRNGDRDGLATVTRTGGDRLLIRHAEVDARDAVDAMTNEEFSSLDFDEDGAFPAHDDRALRDFIAACMAGDRSGALALVPHLFDGRNADTAEQLILSHRRFA